MHTPAAFQRAIKLCEPIAQSWAAVHVAGTNGKGSICKYISAALGASGVKNGSFTSPHLIDRWDGIRIDGKPIGRAQFRRVHAAFAARSRKEGINASPFELLTATALQIFEDEKVEAAVIETGMGGRYDATNVLKHKAVNVISRVALDHQEHLGPTLSEIAYQKCGIFAPNVPIIFSTDNPPDVLRTIRHQAQLTRSRSLRNDFNYDKRFPPSFPNYLPSRQAPKPELLNFDGPQHQRQNKRVAFFAAHTLLCSLGREQNLVADTAIMNAIDRTRVPGRVYAVDLAGAWTRGPVPAMVDGAHNADATRGVKDYIRKWGASAARDKMTSNMTFIVALSGTDKVLEVIAPMLRDGDTVIAVEFNPVAGMARFPYPAEAIRKDLEAHAADTGMRLDLFACDLRVAMSLAEDRFNRSGEPLVVTGSLYIVSDVLRGIRDYKWKGVNLYQRGSPVAEPLRAPGKGRRPPPPGGPVVRRVVRRAHRVVRYGVRPARSQSQRAQASGLAQPAAPGSEQAQAPKRVQPATPGSQIAIALQRARLRGLRNRSAPAGATEG